MKETSVTKYKCEVCHKIYDNKEEAINCEERHKELVDLPVKCICLYNEEFPSIEVMIYNNAKYRKKDDRIRLHTNNVYEGSYFICKYHFYFDEIGVNNEQTIFRIYTTNFDKDYEEKCIKRLLDFGINKLNDRIRRMKEISIKNIQRNEI